MDSSPMLPALLDALASAGIGVVAYRHVGSTTEKLYMSDAFASCIGYSPEEWRKMALWDLVAPAQKQTMLLACKHLLSADHGRDVDNDPQRSSDL